MPSGTVASLDVGDEGELAEARAEGEAAGTEADVGTELVVAIVTELAKVVEIADEVATADELATCATGVREETVTAPDALDLDLHADLDFETVAVPFVYRAPEATGLEVIPDEGLDATRVAPPAADEDTATEAEEVTAPAELEAVATEVAEAAAVCDAEMAPE